MWNLGNPTRRNRGKNTGFQGLEALGEKGDVGQRVQTFSYEMSKFWDSNVQHGDHN